jgi:hypothetical protein
MAGYARSLWFSVKQVMKKTALFPLTAIMIIIMLVMVAFISSNRRGIITMRNCLWWHPCRPIRYLFYGAEEPSTLFFLIYR